MTTGLVADFARTEVCPCIIQLTRKEQATKVSRYYLTFVDCPLACSQRVSRHGMDQPFQLRLEPPAEHPQKRCHHEDQKYTFKASCTSRDSRWNV